MCQIDAAPARLMFQLLQRPIFQRLSGRLGPQFQR
jgi:hypothetical protein